MKIGFIGLDVPEGKVKYEDERLNALAEKISPKKVSPFFVEFVSSDLVHCDALVCLKEKILDLLIPDMDKLEKQIEKTQDEKGKELIKKCLAQLENETPLCNVEFTEEELVIMTELAPLSLKPTVVLEKATDTNEMIKMVLEKAAIVLFYTTAKGELKSWPVKKGSDIVTCASKIHTDLAKGFIRAEVVNYSDFVTVPNIHEAQEKGIVKIVGKDYSIKDGDIIEIRFNV